jgi:hypothetical protein
MRATPGMPAGQSAGASQRGRNALGRGLLVSVAERTLPERSTLLFSQGRPPAAEDWSSGLSKRAAP